MRRGSRLSRRRRRRGEEERRRGEERRGEEEQATDIKSNNPHLAGGEKNTKGKSCLVYAQKMIVSLSHTFHRYLYLYLYLYIYIYLLHTYIYIYIHTYVLTVLTKSLREYMAYLSIFGRVAFGPPGFSL